MNLNKEFWLMIPMLIIVAFSSCNKIDITGKVFNAEDGSPLWQAFITDLRSGKTALTDREGVFSISVEQGDTVTISMVGMVSKTIVVNSHDSIHWEVSLEELSPIIEVALQRSYSTFPDINMTVMNSFYSDSPVDSLVLNIRNNTPERVTFGEVYILEKRHGEEWEPMPYNKKYEEEGCNKIFSLVGYTYSPFSENQNINDTRPYSEKFEKGRYRIIKPFFISRINREDTAYIEFEIL